MALQIRRGPTADRMSYTPVVGELVWDTSTNSLYIGNGSTAGGLPAGTLVTEDVQDIASSMLVDGTHNNIAFTYNDTTGRINSAIDLTIYDGTIEAIGFIGSHFAADSTLLLNASTGAVNLDGTIKGNVVPNANEAYDLGSASNRFRDLYLSGSSIELGAATITAVGAAVELPAGSTINGVAIGTGGIVVGTDYNIGILADDSSTIIDTATKIVTAAGGFIGDITGNVSGNITGDLTGFVFGNSYGDHYGSVFGDDSTTLVDAVTSSLNAAALQGSANLTGVTVAGAAIVNSNNTAVKTLNLTAASAGSVGVSIDVNRSRGTLSAPTTLVTNDTIGSLLFSGHDGSDYYDNAQILSRATGTISTGIVPGTLEFYTANTAGVLVPRLLINETGRFAVVTDTFSITDANTVAAGNLSFRKSRGTTTSPTTVVNGDRLYDIQWSGYDGTNYVTSTIIRSTVDGAVSTGVVPSSFELLLSDAVTGIPTSRVAMDSLGAMVIDANISVRTNSATTNPLLLQNIHNTANNAANFNLQRARGVTTGPLPVQNADVLFDVLFTGMDSASVYQTSAGIRSSVDGTVSSGTNGVPGLIEFRTTPVGGAGGLVTRMRINNSGLVTMYAGVSTGTGEDLANSGAASLALTTSYFTTAAAETATLAAGTEGQVKTFSAVDVTSGNMVITVTNAGWQASGTGTITFTTRGSSCMLQYTNSKWFCIGNNGVSFA